MKEQRSFTRVPFDKAILVNINGERHRAQADNLSLYGLYVRIEQKPDVDTTVEITIPLPNAADEKYIGVSGVVARQTGDGVGIRFQQLDVDTFIEIKNIVSTESGNENKIMDEFFKYITYRETAQA